MAVGSAIIAGLGLAYSVYAGEGQKAEAKKALARQQVAEQKAERQAAAQTRAADEATNSARKKQPDLGVLLADVANGFRPTASSVRADRLLLGRPGLLGV